MTDATPEDIMDVELAEVSPETMDIDRLGTALADGDDLEQVHAARICAVLATNDVDAVGPVLEHLVDHLESDGVTIVKEAATALAIVAEEQPETLESAVGPVVDLFSHDVPLVRAVAGKVARPLVLENAEWFTDHVEGLVAGLQAETADPTEAVDPPPGKKRPEVEQIEQISMQESRRQSVAHFVCGNVLVEISSLDPEAVLPHVPAIADLLEDSTPMVQATAANVIGTIAESDQEAVQDAVGPLCDSLESHNQEVRVNAITALGHIGDPAAVDSLRELADVTEDDTVEEDVRDLAGETADWLESRSE